MSSRNLDLRFRRWWVLSTYFAEGFPYALVRLVSTPYFRDHGASLQAVGMTSLYGLPWNLKFLWAPLVDRLATKRKWLLAAEAALLCLCLTLSALTGAGAGLAAGALVLLFMAVASATHDIAIDGYYLEALDKREQAKFVGFQMMAYRIALIVGGGGVIAFSGLTSWWEGFAAASLVLAVIFLVHFRYLPKIERERERFSEFLAGLASDKAALVLAASAVAAILLYKLSHTPSFKPLRRILTRFTVPQWIGIGLMTAMVVLALNLPRIKRRLYSSKSEYALAFVDYLDQPRIGVILAFIALYRTGESFLLNMAYPFLKEIGISRAQYGVAYGTFGIAAAITGGVLGGALIAKYGLRRCVWPFVLAQNVLNLLYAFMAYRYMGVGGKTAMAEASFYLVAVLVVVEAFGAGLGSSVFQVFIMRTTKPSYRAAHMAIATALMSVGATFAGVASGFLADALGFTRYFALTFAATFPAMTLIPFVPQLKER